MNIELIGLLYYHLIQQCIDAGKVLYLYDFYPYWFFESLNESFIQIAPRPILNPNIIQARGCPRGAKNKQPKSSTRREPSQFEKVIKKKKERKRKEISSGKEKQQKGQESNSEEFHDSEKDQLMEREL